MTAHEERPSGRIQIMDRHDQTDQTGPWVARSYILTWVYNKSRIDEER